MSLSIYANASLGTGPRRTSRSQIVSEPVLESKVPVPRTNLEIEVMRILSMTPSSGESVQKAFDTKEACLRALFATLTSDGRAKLHAVLIADRDPLGFARLSSERRSRVITTLLAGRRRV